MGTTVAILVEDEDDVAAFANYKSEDAPAAPSKPAAAEPAVATPVASTPASTPVAAQKSAPAKSSGGRVFASPLA